jgi:hypothetical protein
MDQSSHSQIVASRIIGRSIGNVVGGNLDACPLFATRRKKRRRTASVGSEPGFDFFESTGKRFCARLARNRHQAG